MWVTLKNLTYLPDISTLPEVKAKEEEEENEEENPVCLNYC